MLGCLILFSNKSYNTIGTFDAEQFTPPTSFRIRGAINSDMSNSSSINGPRIILPLGPVKKKGPGFFIRFPLDSEVRMKFCSLFPSAFESLSMQRSSFFIKRFPNYDRCQRGFSIIKDGSGSKYIIKNVC